MKTFNFLFNARKWTALLATFAACLLLTNAAHAQFDNASGPYIDECSTQQLVGDIYTWPDIEGTACIQATYGGPPPQANGISTYVEISDYYWELDNGTSLASQVQIYDGNYSLVYDSGYQQAGYNDGETYSSGYATPNSNEWYNVVLSAWADYDWLGDYSWNLGGYVDIVPPPSGVQGIIYPKYVVVGVTYAPPGGPNLSSVQYSSTTSIGSTSTYSNSFSSGYDTSIATTFGINVPKGIPNFGGGVTITSSTDNSLTQTQNSSISNTTSKSTSVSYQTAGYPTTFSPNGTQSPALPNDYDVIWVWLNSELIFTATPASGSNPATIQWNGYAYDPYDFDGDDVKGIPVGCLNGDFLSGSFAASNPGYCNQAQNDLDRAWVVNNEPYPQKSPSTGTTVTAPGCPNSAIPVTQTAESPSICPGTQDAYNILAADPVAYIPGASAYAGFNSSPLPNTTPDGRFTLINGSNNPNPVQYQAGQTQTYTVNQMNTQSQSSGSSQQSTEKVEISTTVDTSFFSIFSSKVSYTNTNSFSQTNTWLNTLTTTQTDTSAFTIKASNGPNYLDGTSAPGEFLAYQDNLYGTFLIYPKW